MNYIHVKMNITILFYKKSPLFLLFFLEQMARLVYLSFLRRVSRPMM